jgi:hypothetical protein
MEYVRPVHFLQFHPESTAMLGVWSFVCGHPPYKRLQGCEVYFSTLCYVGNKIQDPFTPRPASHFKRF